MSTQRWLNWPKRDVRTLSPGFRQLVRAASQQPVPDDGKMMGLPDVVLNTGFSAVKQARVNSGKMGDRWSSIGTAIARKTRSGTLVGPGTNKKFRPAMGSPLGARMVRLGCTVAGPDPARCPALFGLFCFYHTGRL